ncbi:hypothetical protein CONLIGDRAFT_688006 [Coniochaeta ligniaria NRRL 30616]|uniref:Uncharacterized protein n=1 Tax=Coniochaeta ligniaria NRRL 30616 TaxID=1408157 RepID=A0A1J7JXX3_9PEZI|nr:hypothetical protein CONLIGDRAFT_688006 [Coniochaeta ligniaria NRRL 30616]
MTNHTALIHVLGFWVLVFLFVNSHVDVLQSAFGNIAVNLRPAKTGICSTSDRVTSTKTAPWFAHLTLQMTRRISGNHGQLTTPLRRNDTRSNDVHSPPSRPLM